MSGAKCLCCLSVNHLRNLSKNDWDMFDLIFHPFIENYPDVYNNSDVKLCNSCFTSVQCIDKFRRSALQNFLKLMAVLHQETNPLKEETTNLMSSEIKQEENIDEMQIEISEETNNLMSTEIKEENNIEKLKIEICEEIITPHLINEATAGHNPSLNNIINPNPTVNSTLVVPNITLVGSNSKMKAPKPILGVSNRKSKLIACRLGNNASIPAANKPKHVAPIPKHVGSKHKHVAPKLKHVGSKPKYVAPNPKSITPNPKSITPNPKSITPNPKPITPNRKSITPNHKSITPNPKSITPNRKSITPNPKSITPNPKSITPNPKSITPNPKSITPNPKLVTPKPKLVTPNPKLVTPNPKLVTPNPISVAPNPNLVIPNPTLPSSSSSSDPFTSLLAALLARPSRPVPNKLRAIPSEDIIQIDPKLSTTVSAESANEEARQTNTLTPPIEVGVGKKYEDDDKTDKEGMCPICKESYDNLKKHMQAHSDAVYCGAPCDKWFAPHSYKTHIKFSSKHRDLKVFRFICDYCGGRFHSKYAIKIHICLKHLNIKGYKCPKCPKMYSSRASMRSHKSVYHDNWRPQETRECDVCGLQFDVEKKFNAHMVTHTGAHPFCCDLCGDTFGYCAALHTHKKRKHKNRSKKTAGQEKNTQEDNSIATEYKKCSVKEENVVADVKES